MTPPPAADRATSEIIGALILISVIVAALALVGVMMFSQPQPQKIPALNAIISTNAQTVNIYHNGGDSFLVEDLQLLLNGQDFTSSFKEDGSAGWSSWSIGQSLTYDIPPGNPVPSLIQIVYKGGGVSHLIASNGEGSTGGGALPVPAPVVTAITPNSGLGGTMVSITNLAGLNFFTGATVKLTRAGYADIPASSVVVVSSSQITCSFNLAGATPGAWNVVVTNPNGPSGTLANGFTVVGALPPVAEFTGTPLSGSIPLNVSFTDQSTNLPTSWYWNFGDGSISTIQNASHLYTVPGMYTVSLNATNVGGSDTRTQINYITVTSPPTANFTGTPTSGVSPLIVSFTDTSTGTPTGWNWSFGDGNFSSSRNPSKTYQNIGNYTVQLNVTYAGGAFSTARKVNYIQVTKKSFVDFIIDDNVFVYGTQLNFAGGTVSGPGATIVIKGPLNNADLNGGAAIAVTTIYIDGDITLTSGSASLGSSSNPGTIYTTGNLNLWGGNRDIYGDVYVAKNFKLKNCNIHGNVYVNGDLTLDYGVPSIDTNKFIYYTGTLTAPNYYDTTFLSKCIKVATVPAFTMPDQTMPQAKSATWYASNGYSTASTGPLMSNSKIYAPSGYSYSYSYGGSNPATNVVIVANTGDISLTSYGGGGVTGVLFAPNGKVTFNGGTFEGVVIARDGFFVTSGGTSVTFKNLDVYISNPADYPF